MTRRVTSIFIALASMAYAPLLPEDHTFVPAAGAIEEFHALLRPDTVSALPGSLVEVRFEVDSSAHQFNGYEVEIRCDPAVLRPDTVFEGSLMVAACPGSRFRLLAKTDSSMTYTHILLCHDVSVDGPGVLSIFRFRDAREGTSPMTVASDPNLTFYDAGEYVAPTHPTRPRQVVFHDGIVQIVDPTSGTDDPGSGSLSPGELKLRLYPNPARRHDTINLDLEGGTPEWIDVLDLQGRKVWDWAGPWTAPGPFVLTAGGNGPAGRSIPPGFYFCRVRASGRQAASGFVLIR